MANKSVLLAAAGTLCLAACTDEFSGENSATPVWANETTVEAIGRAYIEVLPNRANFSVTFEERDPDSAVASAAVIERANAATLAIRNVGGEHVRIRSNLNVAPYYEQITQQRGEFNEYLIENRHPDALLGYTATVVVSVNILDLDVAAAARGAALAAGPARSAPIEFVMQPTAELNREAFAAAVDDATRRARLVAEASGARLGELQVLLEGQAPCLRPPATPAGVDNADYGHLGRNGTGDRVVVTGSRIARSDTVSPSPITNFNGESLQVTAIELSEAAEQYALAADFEPMQFETAVCAIFAVE